MKVGIVGLGYWGSKVFEEYCDLRDEGHVDEIVACDIDSSRLPQTPPADRTARDVAEILPDIDAVHLCVSNDHHFKIAKQALESDTDILVEKPLTVDRERAFDLVELASSRGQILQTGHIFRFANVVRDVKELCENGYFGDVRQISLRWTHSIEPIEGTNVLWDLLPHPLDILNFVTAEWPTEVDVTAAEYRCEQPETALVSYEMNGIIGDLQVSWVDPVRRRQLEIVGSQRGAIVNCVEQSIQVYGQERDEIKVDANNTIRAEANNFINAIETRQNQFNSAIVGARAVDTIEQIEGALT